MDMSAQDNFKNNSQINETEDFDSELYETDIKPQLEGGIKKVIKNPFRFFRKFIGSYVREKMEKRFTNIVFLTAGCSGYTNGDFEFDTSIEYISKMRKQYPEYDIRILIPIINTDIQKPAKKISIEVNGNFLNLEKTSIHFDFFAKNNIWEGI